MRTDICLGIFVCLCIMANMKMECRQDDGIDALKTAVLSSIAAKGPSVYDTTIGAHNTTFGVCGISSKPVKPAKPVGEKTPDIHVSLPLPANYKLDYQWNLPPLDVLDDIVCWYEKTRLMERGIEKKEVGGFYCDARDFYSRQLVIRPQCEPLAGNPRIDDVQIPPDLETQLWPIIESYVTARRAQMDALRKEIEAK